MTTQEILIQANEAKTALALADTARKNLALHKMADSLVKPEHLARILEENAKDMEAAKGTVADVMLDRLLLTHGRKDANGLSCRSGHHGRQNHRNQN